MIKIIPLSELELEPTLEDKFWEARVWKELEDCNDPAILREAVKALLALCTKRQGVIKGLVKFQLLELGRAIQIPENENILPETED